ncbi:hypothetical protein Tco_0240091, partial [Tanacetum coccineum]
MVEKTGKGKMKNVDVGTEDIIGDKPVEAVDGESTDDDFVSSKKTKMNKAVGIKEKTSYATTTNGRSIADKETSMV